MIQYADFIKLFCIMNAGIYSQVSGPKNSAVRCIDLAVEIANLLNEKGAFDKDNCVTQTDFLIALDEIKANLTDLADEIKDSSESISGTIEESFDHLADKITD